MTVLTFLGNLLAILPKEETGLSLFQVHIGVHALVHSGLWLAVRGFACKIATTMAQRSSRPSEDEAASDAAFTYLIGLSGRGMVFRLGWLFRSAWSASNIDARTLASILPLSSGSERILTNS